VIMTWFLLVLPAVASPPAGGVFHPKETTQAVQRRFDAAVQASVASMNWLFRSLARPRIQASVHWCRELELRLTHEVFWSRCDDEAPFVRRFDAHGGTVPDDQGDPMDVSLERRGDRLVLTFENDKARQTTEYRFEDADDLRVDVTITSVDMPVPLAWEIEYERAGGPPPRAADRAKEAAPGPPRP